MLSMILAEIEFRRLNYADEAEVRAYIRLFWEIPLEHNEYFVARSEEFLANWFRTACKTETPETTFSGIALHHGQIIGIHLLRRFEEFETVGAHIAGLWVHPDYRGQGIARTLKSQGEAWARSVGATFLNTNVHPQNARMLAINEEAGFSLFRLNLRKRLS